MVSPVAHLLNRTLELYRRVLTEDGHGGFSYAWTKLADVRAKVNQPTELEQVVGGQQGNTNTFDIHMLPDAPVQRNDELRDGALVYEVTGLVYPSRRIYLKAIAELKQHEGDNA